MIARYSWAGISTPLLNAASLFAEEGWKVVIYAPNADLNRFPFPSHLRGCLLGIPPEEARKLDVFGKFSILRSAIKKSDLIFFFDHQSLFYLAGALFVKAKKVYFSLEFLEKNSNSELRLRSRLRYLLLKMLERLGAHCCDLVISQDLMRCNYLRTSLGVNRLSVVHNSPRKPIPSSDSRYFRDRFGIDDSVFILLCVGTLNEDTLLHFLLGCAPLLPKRFAIVLHGWFTDPRQAELARRLEKLYPGSLYVSTDLIDSSKKWMIYNGSDSVFVGFTQSNNNLRLALGSAGKLYDALACGKPVVVNASHSHAFVNGKGRGKVVRDCHELATALNEISNNYSEYQKRCLAASLEFSHDKSMVESLRLLSISI